MTRIKWTDKITNKEVFQRAHTERSLINTIVTKQIRFLGHVLRKDKIEAFVLIGKIQGKRGRGRPRLSFMGWMERATGNKPIQLMRMMKENKMKL